MKKKRKWPHHFICLFNENNFSVLNKRTKKEKKNKTIRIFGGVALMTLYCQLSMIQLHALLYEVTAQEMQKAWESATETGYLDSLQLSKCANNSEKLKTVRMESLQLLHSYNLHLSTKRKAIQG
jgi:hypothetical protein